MSPHTTPYQRAEYCVAALASLLPHIHWEVYSPCNVLHFEARLYLFGYILDDVLLGGYHIPTPIVPVDKELLVLRIAQFFENAWSEGTIRFYPETLHGFYKAYQKQEAAWRRII